MLTVTVFCPMSEVRYSGDQRPDMPQSAVASVTMAGIFLAKNFSTSSRPVTRGIIGVRAGAAGSRTAVVSCRVLTVIPFLPWSSSERVYELGRVAHRLLGLADLGHLAVFHHHDLIRDMEVAIVMADDDHRFPAGLQLRQDLGVEDLLEGRVLIGGPLVEQVQL